MWAGAGGADAPPPRALAGAEVKERLPFGGVDRISP